MNGPSNPTPPKTLAVLLIVDVAVLETAYPIDDLFLSERRFLDVRASTLDALVNRIQTNYTDDTSLTSAKVIIKSNSAEYVGKAVSLVKSLLPQQHPLLVKILHLLDAENCDDHLLKYVGGANTYQEMKIILQMQNDC